jgi:uncharacterized protein YbgA (DUF1722 family)
VRLVKIADNIHVHSNKSGEDLTEPLLQQSHYELSRLNTNNICGIIFKSKSPSCGLKSAKLYLENGYCEGKEDGVFAHLCREHYPLLPMEEEGRLEDAWLRENFIMQLFAYERFELFKSSSPTFNDLVHFHTIHKFMLQAKDEQLYRALGNIIGNHDSLPLETIIGIYEFGFKTAIGRKSSIKRTRNVLERMAGFFKNDLDKSEKEILHSHIQDYADKIVPLIVPLSTVYLYAKKYDTHYLLDQIFLNPYPKTLALRSAINSGK